MKLFEYLENSILKSNIIEQLKDQVNQFNKDLISRDNCLKQMRQLIKDTKFKWILSSLEDIREPSLYLKIIKDL